MRPTASSYLASLERQLREYGIHDAFVGVMVKLGAKGIEQIIEVPLSESERLGLHKAAEAVKELVRLVQ